jgi:hypothetical protein
VFDPSGYPGVGTQVFRQSFIYPDVFFDIFFISTGSRPRRANIPFETLKDSLAHGLALQSRLRLDFASQFYVDVSKDLVRINIPHVWRIAVKIVSGVERSAIPDTI